MKEFNLNDSILGIDLKKEIGFGTTDVLIKAHHSTFKARFTRNSSYFDIDVTIIDGNSTKKYAHVELDTEKAFLERREFDALPEIENVQEHVNLLKTVYNGFVY